MDRLSRQDNSVVISCGLKLNLDYLLDQIWEYLQLLRVYTKKRGGRVYEPKHINFKVGCE